MPLSSRWYIHVHAGTTGVHSPHRTLPLDVAAAAAGGMVALSWQRAPLAMGSAPHFRETAVPLRAQAEARTPAVRVPRRLTSGRCCPWDSTRRAATLCTRACSPLRPRLLLPFGLYEAFGDTWNHVGLVPAVAVMSIFFFGIEALHSRTYARTHAHTRTRTHTHTHTHTHTRTRARAHTHK